MSFCIECLNFKRRSRECMKNNPMKKHIIDARCESLFRKCSDYILDREHFFVRDDVLTESSEVFVVTYHGLLDKIHIAEVNSEKKAQEMCLQHNRTVPKHWFECGISHMSYVKKNKEA